VNGSGSGSCTVAGFESDIVEPLASGATVFVTYLVVLFIVCTLTKRHIQRRRRFLSYCAV